MKVNMWIPVWALKEFKKVYKEVKYACGFQSFTTLVVAQMLDRYFTRLNTFGKEENSWQGLLSTTYFAYKENKANANFNHTPVVIDISQHLVDWYKMTELFVMGTGLDCQTLEYAACSLIANIDTKKDLREWVRKCVEWEYAKDYTAPQVYKAMDFDLYTDSSNRENNLKIIGTSEYLFCLFWDYYNLFDVDFEQSVELASALWEASSLRKMEEYSGLEEMFIKSIKYSGNSRLREHALTNFNKYIGK